MPLIVAAASALLRRSPWLTCRGLIGFRKQAASEDQIHNYIVDNTSHKG